MGSGTPGKAAGAEVDGVELLQRAQGVGRHHLAAVEVVPAAPGEVLELQDQVASDLGQRFEGEATFANYLESDPVAGNDSNGVRGHGNGSGGERAEYTGEGATARARVVAPWIGRCRSVPEDQRT